MGKLNLQLTKYGTKWIPVLVLVSLISSIMGWALGFSWLDRYGWVMGGVIALLVSVILIVALSWSRQKLPHFLFVILVTFLVGLFIAAALTVMNGMLAWFNSIIL
jgi:uncharacterized membrane protein YoaK (UPF0700 family)